VRVARALDLSERAVQISAGCEEQRSAAPAGGERERPIKLATARSEHVRQSLCTVELSSSDESLYGIRDEERADRLGEPALLDKRCPGFQCAVGEFRIPE
jgi:hypothetical protein